ncbi:Hypothetical predicted protein, partial [Olea europaea subsp. europaea]
RLEYTASQAKRLIECLFDAESGVGLSELVGAESGVMAVGWDVGVILVPGLL